MDFLPWTTFTRIVDRHGGDRYVKLLAACLSAQVAKLYHMGFRHTIKRSTLADANETRDWRIHAEFAQCLIAQARKLYLGDRFGLELEHTTYALDSITIDLCLSLPYLRRQGDIATQIEQRMHLHRRLGGAKQRPGWMKKLGDVNVLDMLVLEAGAIYVMDCGSLDFARLYVLHQAHAFLVTRAKSNNGAE